VIREIFFDVNETMTDFSGLVQPMAGLGLDQTETGAWFSELLRDGFALTITDDRPSFAEIAREALVSVLTRKGQTVDPKKVDGVIQAITTLSPHPDVAPALKTLVDAGHSLNTISNGSSAIAERLLASEGLTSLVTRVLSVEGQAPWKPHRGAYEFALEQTGVEPHQAALVASHPWDVHGARGVGMFGVWLNREVSHYPSYFHPPSATIHSLRELPEWLRSVHP
jgi:2-haloacid dehalogenase